MRLVKPRSESTVLWKARGELYYCLDHDLDLNGKPLWFIAAVAVTESTNTTTIAESAEKTCLFGRELEWKLRLEDLL